MHCNNQIFGNALTIQLFTRWDMGCEGGSTTEVDPTDGEGVGG